MQIAVTYLLIAVAAIYALYELARTILPSKLSKACGHGCGACPASKILTKKGEPAELIPLEGLIRR
jgi:hypothetical protein